jgi:hypothetical protein
MRSHCLYRVPLYLLFIFLIVASISPKVFSQSSFRKMRYSHRTPQEAVKWQNQARKELFGLFKLNNMLDSHTRLPLQPRTIAKHDSGSYWLQEIEIQSTPGRRIAVILTIPKQGPAPYPAVVCVHGHGGTRRIVYDSGSIYKGFAAELARSGYITIAADVGQHEVFKSGHTLMGERLWDLIRCVDYLCSMDPVDNKRIGCAGLSLGGEMTMWLGAMDERIAATVSSGFLTMMDQMEKNHCMCWKFDGLRERVDWPDVYSLIAPRPLECQNGLKEPKQDFYVPLARQAMAEVQIIYQDLGKPEAALLQVHPGAHEIDLPALMAFFHNNL